MKLSTKTNLYYLAILITAFSVCGILFYFSLLSDIDENTNEKLQEEKLRITEFILNKGMLPENVFMLGDSVAFVPCAIPSKEEVKDTFLLNAFESELLPYRMFAFPVSLGNINYKAIIYKPMIESEDLAENIIWTISWIVALLLALLFLFNFFILRNVWAPFYSTLERIKSFELSKENIEFDASKVREFQELNTVLAHMTSKIVRDYRNMKEFAENASHETQTPLTIIKSRLEVLIQSGKLDEQQMKEIQAVYESATRLSKLNQSLLLLAKIENHQFSEMQLININELINKKLELFDDLILHKEVQVKKSIQNKLTIDMNPALADILINNLISNAIKHNIKGGKLIIETTNTNLIISNSGLPLKHDPNKLFERFAKENSSSDSLGLGLAIVKQICNSFNFVARYSYVGELHEIKITIA